MRVFRIARGSFLISDRTRRNLSFCKSIWNLGGTTKSTMATSQEKWPQAYLAVSRAKIIGPSRPACGLIELCMIFPLGPVNIDQSACDDQVGRAFALRITRTLSSLRGPWPPPVRSVVASAVSQRAHRLRPCMPSFCVCDRAARS